MKLDGNNITADEADEADIQGDSVYHVITIYVQQFHKDTIFSIKPENIYKKQKQNARFTIKDPRYS